MHDFSVDKLVGNFQNLDLDINAIDTKLSEIEQLLLDLRNNMNRSQALLRKAQPQDRKGLYSIINASMELLSTYYQTHQKFMDLKFKYRKEQDDLTYKAAHMVQIELAKLDSDVNTSYDGVIELLKSISKSDKGQLPDEAQTEIDSVISDDLYSMK